MASFFTADGVVAKVLDDGGYHYLSPCDDSSELYLELQDWLAAGNKLGPPPEQPEPTPPTAAEKLAALGLTADDLRQLLNPEVNP
jgi:hypothetical protein